VCVYRLPGNVTAEFCDELCDMFDRLQLPDKHYLLYGDFNCPISSTNTVINARLQDILPTYNQKQLVTAFSIHKDGNTLDLLNVPDTAVISDINIVHDVSVHSQCFSDHSLIRCHLGVDRDQSTKVTYNLSSHQKL